MARLTKDELIRKVNESVGSEVNKKQVELVFDAIFSSIREEMVAGNEVPIHEFGVFGVKRREERPGFNPRTKEATTLKAKNMPTFKFSTKVKNAVENS